MSASPLFYSGFGVAFFFIIIESPAVGGGALTFIWRCICFRKVSGSGIPGVGVAPGLNGFLRVAGSGMPGVGVAPF